MSAFTAVASLELPSNALSLYVPEANFRFKPATTALGMNVMSAPVSINIGTSLMVSWLSGFRRLTLATGAGGSKRLSSYVGIGSLFDYFLHKVVCLTRISETWTQNLKRALSVRIWNQHVDVRIVWDIDAWRKRDMSVLNNAFIRSNLSHLIVRIYHNVTHRSKGSSEAAYQAEQSMSAL